MSLLYRVIYAAHANGTHHKLALDALQRLTRADADAWQRLMLKHVQLYLDGSKAPDVEFKDFQNHILHVEDGYWGGAPDKAESWYRNLVAALKAANWAEAAWCAGVLSHYVTDPVHPFHTGQSTAENDIHRAVEWSISRDYDALKREGEISSAGRMVAVPSGPKWLTEHVCRGAELAHRHYGALIAHYDINVGVVDPPAGLDSLARGIVGDLIVYAADSFARVLERAIEEADVAPPQVSLALETVLATLAIPMKRLQKRLADAEDRRIVEAMYDELMATGRVEVNLPEDDRMVRDLHAREVLAKRNGKLAAKRDERLRGAPPALRPKVAVAPAASAGGAAVATTQQPAPAVAAASGPAHAGATASDDANRFAHALGLAHPSRPRVASLSERLSELAAKPARERSRKAVAPTDDVEAAPAIGPKIAASLRPAGIRTIADLLAADAAATATSVGAPHITAGSIGDWQAATRLVMAVPIINGTQAQLLVGAGVRSAEAIAAADPVDLCAALLNYAGTREGQRLLRDGAAPDIERVKLWVAAAEASSKAA